jgi:integrase
VANKAGQIIARGERTWLVRIFMGRDAESGKRQYHNKTIHGTRRDAQAYLNQAQRDRDLGIFFEPSRMSLDQYLDKWLETAAKPKLRAKTHRDYEALLERYVRPALGCRPVSKIEPLDIQGLYTEMQERDLSARTVRFTHAVLRSALHQAVKWRLIPLNPAESVDLPRQAKGEMQVLAPQQARDFLEAAKTDRYYVLFALALTTGMRPSEYLALKWPDVDWNKGTVSVTRTLEPIRGGGWQFADTKRARSRRVVRLQDWVVDLLKQHQFNSPQENQGRNVPADAADLIFTNTNGNALNERNLVLRNFQDILERAKLPRIRLYDLRHTAATLALAAGVPAKVVSEQLGHASVAFTLDTYSHVLPHMQDAAAAQVEALLLNARAKNEPRRSKRRRAKDTASS